MNANRKIYGRFLRIKENCLPSRMPLFSTFIVLSLHGLPGLDLLMYWIAIGILVSSWVEFVVSSTLSKEIDIFENYRSQQVDGSAE